MQMKTMWQYYKEVSMVLISNNFTIRMAFSTGQVKHEQFADPF